MKFHSHYCNYSAQRWSEFKRHQLQDGSHAPTLSSTPLPVLWSKSKGFEGKASKDGNWSLRLITA